MANREVKGKWSGVLGSAKFPAMLLLGLIRCKGELALNTV
jgi:hypothetical protein